MDNLILTPQELACQNKDGQLMVLNAWTAQNVVYELIKNHMLTNPPDSLGFKFSQKYHEDYTKSDIHLDIAYNWDANKTQKRPAIFVQRGPLTLANPTIGSKWVGSNYKDSEMARMIMLSLPIYVKCIATNVGFTEHLAEYIKYPLVTYQQEIQQDFGFQQFRLKEVSAPEIYIESKEHFAIILTMSTAFVEGFIVQRDDLKLKTVSTSIFDGCTKAIITNQ